MINTPRSGSGSTQSPRSPSSQPYLSVLVTDPVKLGNGVQAYISYRVITKTNLPEYQGPEKIVIRRYSDFVWLRDRLFEKFKGIFIPPIPEKSAVEKFRFSAEFIEMRRQALDIFVNRIASHHELQQSEDLRTFLQADEETMERLRAQETGIFKKKPADLMQIFKDVQSKVSDVVLGKEKPVEESNPEYEKLKHYVFELENHLAEAQKHAYRLVKRHRELGQSLSDFGKAVKLLGACEGDSLGKTFSELGVKSETLSIRLQKEAHQLLMNFEEPLKDYVRAVQSIKATIAERANAFRQQCELAETIKLKEINLDKLMLTRSDRVGEAEIEYKELKGFIERRHTVAGPNLRSMAKPAIGCEPLVGSLVPSKKRDYKVTNKLQEGKRPLYAVAFNFIDSRYFNVFATVGGNRATVYQCLEGGVIAALQSYVDEDKDESFYTVSWACNAGGIPFLVAGGINGIIRVIDVSNEKLHKSFVGHGDSINEIRTQPLKPSLVVSASKDESVRLWNVDTGICILIFAGAGGHRNEVLSVDFHPSDIYRIASCGMDNTVKIWSMKEFWTYVEKSFTWTDLPSKFPTKYVQFPVFIASVHSNYVDCNRWLGDFVLSKSVDNEIVLWEPKMKEQSPGEGTADILQKYPVPECDIWFIKFSCDFHYNAAAIGNREGKIYVWELQSSPPVLIARLSHAQSKSPIRQTAMSFDGSTILSCCEDGAIWRWDAVPSS